MRQSLRHKLITLTEIPGLSGHETPIVEYLSNALAPLADQVDVDSMGNVIALKRGQRPGPRLMIAAHLDQIGALVSFIDERGFLRFEKIGGTLDSLLVGRKVRVGGDVFGVIGVKPGHYQSPEERRRVVDSSELFIDVGATDREEVKSWGIEIGTPVLYHDELSFFQNGTQFCGAGVDNRAGCAVLWQLLESLSDGDFGGEVHAVFTVQEETGLKGAQVAAERIQPDFGLALDTIPCGGTPDVSEREIPTAIGQGPVFAWVTGARGKFSTPPIIRQLLIEAAGRAQVDYQVMVFAGGGNDASSIQLSGTGVPAGSVTLPRRYSHSPVETGDLRDAEAATRLLESVVRDMEQRSSFNFLG